MSAVEEHFLNTKKFQLQKSIVMCPYHMISPMQLHKNTHLFRMASISKCFFLNARPLNRVCMCVRASVLVFKIYFEFECSERGARPTNLTLRGRQLTV